jgi:hypothetical protein
MSNQYSIAVLLPTRGRTEALLKSLTSVVDLALHVDRLQIMLGLDDDDTVGLDYFEKTVKPWLDDRGANYTAMVFAPMGYVRLNEYVNELAKNSSADWLVFWNDDAVMQTDHWDKIIADHTGEFKILAFDTHRAHPYSIFPIVPRAWLDQLGHLSPHQISDAWISQNAYCLDILERIPVQVTHDRADLTGNNKDQTYLNRPMLEGNPNSPRDFHHWSWAQQRVAECQQLSAYMKTQGLDTTWWDNVQANRQDPWQRLQENDINSQMVQFNIKAPLTVGGSA